jgi:diguanylate cyclase (GGDEF)-like protein
VPVETRTAPIHAGIPDRIVGGVEIFSDATGLIEARDEADRARHDALTDPLTGLPNRRLLDAVLASRRDEMDRHQVPFGFLMIDVDHFKRFNDEHGHDVGDQALRIVARTLNGALRSGDTLVRWGGEEFAIVASGVTDDGMGRLAERLLRMIRATRVIVPSGSVPIRVSIGGAIALPGQSLDQLFVRADQALLAAKASGRDRFVLEGQPAAEVTTAPGVMPEAPAVVLTEGGPTTYPGSHAAR